MLYNDPMPSAGLEQGYHYARSLRGRIMDLSPEHLDRLAQAIHMMNQRAAKKYDNQVRYRERKAK